MVKRIVYTASKEYQLVSIGINLVNKVLSGIDCKPELTDNIHISKAHDLAKQWNEVFFDLYVTKQGAK